MGAPHPPQLRQITSATPGLVTVRGWSCADPAGAQGRKHATPPGGYAKTAGRGI